MWDFCGQKCNAGENTVLPAVTNRCVFVSLEWARYVSREGCATTVAQERQTSISPKLQRESVRKTKEKKGEEEESIASPSRNSLLYLCSCGLEETSSITAQVLFSKFKSNVWKCSCSARFTDDAPGRDFCGLGTAKYPRMQQLSVNFQNVTGGLVLSLKVVSLVNYSSV